jgi:hypothetical protein
MSESALIPLHKQENNTLQSGSIESHVKAINDLNRQSGQCKEKIGEYLYEKVFDAQITSKSARKPDNPSYRQLSRNKNLDISPSELNRTLRVYLQDLFFTEQKCDTTNLSFSAKKELLPLGDKEKLLLVEDIMRDGYSSRKVRKRVKELRSSNDKTGGDNPIKSSKLKRAFTGFTSIIDGAKKDLGDKTEQELGELKAMVKGLREKIDELDVETSEAFKRYQVEPSHTAPQNPACCGAATHNLNTVSVVN